MPMKYVRKKKAVRGKRYAKRRTGGRLTGNFLKTSMIRPDRMLVKLPWTANYVTATSESAVTGRTFRLNSIWDPDWSVSTGQTSANGATLYNQIYGKYRVFGATVELTLDNGTTGASVPSCIVPSQQVWNAGPFGTTSMQPMARRFMLGNGSGQSRYSTRFYVSMPRVAGQTSSIYKGDDTNSAAFDENPARDIILNVVHAPTVGACGVTMTIRIVYHVELFSPYGINALSDPHPAH